MNDLDRFQNLADFVERLCRDRPVTLEASEIHHVRPNPWIWRTGSGKDARIRMRVGEGKLRYWRRPEETTWQRAEWTPQFDIGSMDGSG